MAGMEGGGGAHGSKSPRFMTSQAQTRSWSRPVAKKEGARIDALDPTDTRG